MAMVLVTGEHLKAPTHEASSIKRAKKNMCLWPLTIIPNGVKYNLLKNMMFSLFPIFWNMRSYADMECQNIF